MRTHTGERRFSCEFCDEKFTRLYHLRTHMRIRTGERPFSCEVCGKKFRMKSSVECHMLVHSCEYGSHEEFCSVLKKFNISHFYLTLTLIQPACIQDSK